MRTTWLATLNSWRHCRNDTKLLGSYVNINEKSVNSLSLHLRLFAVDISVWKKQLRNILTIDYRTMVDCVSSTFSQIFNTLRIHQIEAKERWNLRGKLYDNSWRCTDFCLYDSHKNESKQDLNWLAKYYGMPLRLQSCSICNIKAGGITWLASRPQNSNSSSKSGPQTLVG